MSILDSAILLGKETTYGTAASLTRAFEGKADSFKREQNYIDSIGFRANMEALRSDRFVVENLGGTGELELDILNKGFGMLFEGMFGTSTGPTQQGATIAYSQTHTTDDTGPTSSYTIQVLRSVVGGTTQQFTHLGAVVTGWTISQDVNGLANLKVSYDFRDVETSTSAGTPSYPAGTTPFAWNQVTVTLDPNGSATVLQPRDFSFSADLGFDTNRRRLTSSGLKAQPVRNSVPSYTGSMTVDFEGLTEYNRWVNGDVFALRVAWTGAVIESSYNYTLQLDLPAVQYTGESPVASLSELSSQPLPFRALHDGTNPVVTLTYISTDTAF